MDKEKHIEDILNSIIKKDVDGLNKEFIYQSAYFNSTIHNSTMKNIEKNLNELYETARMLEDVVNYAKDFIKTNIYSVEKDCVSILESIEDNIDSLKSSGYISLNVPIEESIGSYLDRNNSMLPKHAIYDGTITLSSKDEIVSQIESIKCINNFIPYKQTVDNLKNKEVYRTFYMVDNPIKDGMKEKLHITFKNEITANQLEIISSNYDILDVVYESNDKTLSYISKHKNVIQKDKKVKSVIVTSNIPSYKKMTYYVDESRVSKNFWDTISENEYNANTSGKRLSQAEIDKLAGLESFKTEYDIYLKKVEDWKKRRSNTVKTNIANGYFDSEENIDIIVPPQSIKNSDLNLNENIEKKASLYQQGKIVQENVRYSESIFPDTEKIYYQNLESTNCIDKTGKEISYFTDEFKKMSSDAYVNPEIK